MSGETSVKFLIPESSCQKSFEVWALFANETKESVLRCDWLKEYYCDSAPGYTHTLENSTALITVSRDLERKPDDFICDSLFRPKTDPSWCLCKRAEFIPGQPDSDSPEQVALIASLGAILGLLLLVLVGISIYKYCCRQNSSEYQHDPNVRPDEHEPSNEPRMNAPLISATDSQKSSTATVIYFSCGAVQLIKKPTDPNSRPKPPRPFKPPPETAETSIQNSPAIEEPSEAKKDAPKISLTDSQKSSTATLICVSCGTVQLIKMLIEAKKDAPKISATDSQKSSMPTVIVPPTETVTPKKKPIEAKKDAPTISLTDSQKSSTATVICFSCGAVQLIKIPTSQTGEPSMDVPQMSAADLQESSTPAVTPPPTETVPPKKETKLGRNKTHP